MKKIILLLPLFLLILSCKEETKLLIPEEKMVDLLVDIHLADGVLNTKSFPYEEKQLRAENYYQNVLDNHQISRLDFDSALSQYSINRILYIEIYDKVIEKLRTKESYVQANVDSTKANKEKFKKLRYTFNTDYENGITINPDKKKNITELFSKSGKYSYHVNDEKYSNGYSVKVSEPLIEVEYRIKAQVLFTKLPKELPHISFTIQKGDELLSVYRYNFRELKLVANEWAFIDIKTKLVLPQPKKDVLVKAYFNNKKQANFFIDDYALEIKQIK